MKIELDVDFFDFNEKVIEIYENIRKDRLFSDDERMAANMALTGLYRLGLRLSERKLKELKNGQ